MIIHKLVFSIVLPKAYEGAEFIIQFPLPELLGESVQCTLMEVKNGVEFIVHVLLRRPYMKMS